MRLPLQRLDDMGLFHPRNEPPMPITYSEVSQEELFNFRAHLCAPRILTLREKLDMKTQPTKALHSAGLIASDIDGFFEGAHKSLYFYPELEKIVPINEIIKIDRLKQSDKNTFEIKYK